MKRTKPFYGKYSFNFGRLKLIGKNLNTIENKLINCFAILNYFPFFFFYLIRLFVNHPHYHLITFHCLLISSNTSVLMIFLLYISSIFSRLLQLLSSAPKSIKLKKKYFQMHQKPNNQYLQNIVNIKLDVPVCVCVLCV